MATISGAEIQALIEGQSHWVLQPRSPEWKYIVQKLVDLSWERDANDDDVIVAFTPDFPLAFIARHLVPAKEIAATLGITELEAERSKIIRLYPLDPKGDKDRPPPTVDYWGTS